jgi:two-component system sensor histidine kinase BaeS
MLDRRPMPAWWPAGEPWDPRRGGPADEAPRGFPIGIALLFAIAINLVAAGVLGLTRGMVSALPWAYAFPAFALALVTLAAVAFVAAVRWIASPLSRMVAAAHRVGNGDFSVRLDEDGLPWLRGLAAAFNTMTTRLERQQRERQALMADVAHELRTPVAVIQGRLEGILDGVYPADETHVRQVVDETRMLARLVEDLRTSAHAESGTLSLHREPTDIAVLVEDAAAASQPEADRRGIRVETQLTSELPIVDVDPQRIREVLINLLSNAVRYSPDGGTVTISGERTAAGVLIRIVDRGPGIPEGALARVFERFNKSPDSPGSGLGLSIAKSLVEAHGGTIHAAHAPGGGTVVSVVMPV